MKWGKGKGVRGKGTDVVLQTIFLSLSLLPLPLVLSLGASDSSGAMTAFEERRYLDALGGFLDLLREDPGNVQAKAYITLISRQIDADRRLAARQKRLALLESTAEHLEAGQQESAPVRLAIEETSTAEQRARAERWRLMTEEARLKRETGDLIAAQDLIFQVLEEDASFAPAQRELSELQSLFHRVIEGGMTVSLIERFAYQGFFAYGQADDEGALVAWGKLRSVAGSGQLKTLRIERYEAKARERVEARRREQAQARWFEQGVERYRRNQFMESLDLFRRVAIENPEYPMLGHYLVKAEAGAEQERARRLGEKKRQAFARAFDRGTAALLGERHEEAITAFEQALRIDPGHAPARSHLALARAQAARRIDPQAARQRYESGLVAYASGKLDEAARQWRLALQCDPNHEKARLALAKVQKELAMEPRSHAALP